MILVAIALVLKIAFPPGFMAGGPSNDSPFTLVLCTDQGAVFVSPGDALPTKGQRDEPPASPHDSPCVFAAKNLGVAPQEIIHPEVSLIAYEHRHHATGVDLAPARRQTGPPLPARGPPYLI